MHMHMRAVRSAQAFISFRSLALQLFFCLCRSSLLQLQSRSRSSSGARAALSVELERQSTSAFTSCTSCLRIATVRCSYAPSLQNKKLSVSVCALPPPIAVEPCVCRSLSGSVCSQHTEGALPAIAASSSSSLCYRPLCCRAASSIRSLSLLLPLSVALAALSD
jgi:hypothetical protein